MVYIAKLVHITVYEFQDYFDQNVSSTWNRLEEQATKSIQSDQVKSSLVSVH